MKSSLNKPLDRRGATLIEMTVALGLLLTVMSVTASLAVRNQRVLADNRVFRLTVDDLSNRLDRLVAMSAADAARAIAALRKEEPSGPFTGATLVGDVDDDDFGRRITLTLSWPGVAKRRPDITLSAWSYDDRAAQEGQP